MQNDNNDYEFIGWIPCVSGKLYFEFTACDVINNNGNGFLNANHIEFDSLSNKQKRYFVIASEVDWEDFKIEGLSGIWNVVLTSDAEVGSREITGHVFLVPKQISAWEISIVEILKNISELTNQQMDVKAEYMNLVSILNSLVPIRHAFVADFVLKDNGLTWLKNESADKDDDTSLLVSRQSYYYLKYSFHKDKHHKRSESLTTVHRLPNHETNVGLLLIDDIKKALVTLARDCHPSDYKMFFSAKGILSYGKSLLNSCKSQLLLDSDTYAIEKTYFDNMAESLDVIGKRVESEINLRTNFDNTFRSIGLFLFASIAPFTLLYKDELRAQLHINNENVVVPHLLSMLEWFIGNERHFVLSVICVILGYYLLKRIQLRYGAPFLAFDKLSFKSMKIIEVVVDYKGAAEKILMLLYAVIFVCLTVLVIQFASS
jgi:hypothetical protein